MNCYTQLINRNHLLPATYIPNDLVEVSFPFCAKKHDPKKQLRKEAAHYASMLFSHAYKEHMTLVGISGYRSFERQKVIYDQRKEDLYIAPPGGSEHQSGLALDVSCACVSYELTTDFAFTPEGKWLAEHASLYGFILRYPNHKTQITGYAWEPWHIRYVTRELALFLDSTGQTLEEFHQLKPS